MALLQNSLTRDQNPGEMIWLRSYTNFLLVRKSCNNLYLGLLALKTDFCGKTQLLENIKYQEAFQANQEQKPISRYQPQYLLTNQDWQIILKVAAHKNKRSKTSGYAFKAKTLEVNVLFTGGASSGSKPHHLAIQDVVGEAIFKAMELGYNRILILSNSKGLVQNGIYLNGVHHWLGLLMDKFEQCECEIIVSFDMGNEVFQITKLPELDNVLREKYKFFAAFNGCLALIFVDKIEETLENVFDIWVMCEFGVRGSWTKQLVVITPQLEIERPLGFAKNEKLFLLSKDRHAIFLYNIGSQEIKNLPFRGLLNSNRKGHVRVYVESLVSFTGGYVFQYNQAPNDLYNKLHLIVT
ncbi:hypothetical protein SO802_011216 [Lithocarpus litseifolius]|uniref:F-box associated beta-propeller type 3 domain-containing protein n=1 Tax=Lithocarpus litseifolius TaxID=425828 RepID=A0AAW2D3G5_9ROSI